ncbi:Noc2-domain-containing protein [Patellaria atrata CBS 101060]|uniref:Noc2-domain-containing protein n=1 Tax=Patellaria atrata CBS 101060 TaxID=1346257 RepID=A0A9P4VN08_9PEZI|nr:Noc2-domain-containing protein [Patellaria atrata CBS 101060]
MPQTKATRKFEKNKLKDVLKRRKEGAKFKQKVQLKEKKKAKRAKENARAEDLEDGPKKAQPGNNPFGEMTVDEFFQGGFDIPELHGSKSKKKASKESQQKSRKRKRTPPEDKDDGSDTSMVDGGAPIQDNSEHSSDEDVEDHKEQLNALAKKDPEFYRFLQEEDAELLNFDENADLAEIDDLSASEEDEPRKKQKKSKKSKEQEMNIDTDEELGTGATNEVTQGMVKKWKAAMVEQNSLRSTREVVLAFRAAAHLNEDGKEFKYSISNSEVYHDLLLVALSHVPEVLYHHLPVKETAGGKVRVPTDSKKYKSLSTLLKSHATSIHHLLENLSDASALRLTLSSLLPLLPYTLSFKKLVRDLARAVIDVWSDSSNAEATRIAAFLVLRRLVVIGDPSIKEAVLKSTYQGLVKGSRNTTVHSITGVNLMKNSAAELWGLDPSLGYTTGFTFIRQLAIHLRSSLTNNSNESYKAVYNWQFVHSLDFWSRVLSLHCESLREAQSSKESPLRPLIYPTVQITLGTMRLIPTAQYFPLRFHLIRALLRISLATHTYIPLAPSLLEVLNATEMKKPPKNSTLKPLDFSTAYHAPKSYLRTRVYQDGLGDQVCELLSEFFFLWTKSIAFPELALPVVVMLKRWLKTASNRDTGNKNGKVNSMMGVLVQKLEANGRWIEERRARVEFAPNDRAGVDGFLREEAWEGSPLGAFVVGQRKGREEKAKVVEEGRREEERKRKMERKEEKEDGEEFGGFEEESGTGSGSESEEGSDRESD